MQRLELRGILFGVTIFFLSAFAVNATAGIHNLALSVMLVEKIPTSRPKLLGLYGERFCKKEGWHCLFIKELKVYNLIEKKDKRGQVRYIRSKTHSHEYWIVNLSSGKEHLFGSKIPDWSDLWPEEEKRTIIMHLNRMNIALRPGMIIAVPDNLEGKTLMDFSPFPRRLNPAEMEGLTGLNAPRARRLLQSRSKVIIWDPKVLAYAAYERDQNKVFVLIRWGAAVGGMDKCPEEVLRGRSCRTVVGNFEILNKRGPEARSTIYPLDKKGRPCTYPFDEWGRRKKESTCAPVPYIMTFHGSGYGFHVSEENKELKIGGLPGRNASHGCIRLFREDGTWLNTEFAEVAGKNKKATLVIVRPYPTPNQSAESAPTEFDQSPLQKKK